MRNRTLGAVVMGTLTLSTGLAGAAHAAPADVPESTPVVAFTPPIGTEHGSVLAQSPVQRAPTGFELDLIW